MTGDVTVGYLNRLRKANYIAGQQSNSVALTGGTISGVTLSKNIDQTGIFNLSPANLPKWRKALGNVQAGVGPAKINWIGDSTTAGIPYTYAQAIPYITAQRLTAMGIPSENNSVIGGNNLTGSAFSTYNPRVTFGGNAAIAGLITVGGNAFSVNTSTSSIVNFGLTNAYDTLDVYYPTGPSIGSATVSFDGGAVAATIVGTSGTLAALKQTVSASSAAVHACAITWSAGGAFYPIGVEGYVAATPKVRHRNIGWCSGNSSNWVVTGNSYSPLTLLGNPVFGADLSIIRLGTNDWGSTFNVPLATFVTNLQTLITQCLTTGDVILCAPAFDNQTTQASEQLYVSALYSLAISNNIVLVDDSARWVSYTVSSALFNADGVHLTTTGYQDLTTARVKALLI